MIIFCIYNVNYSFFISYLILILLLLHDYLSLLILKLYLIRILITILLQFPHTLNTFFHFLKLVFLYLFLSEWRYLLCFLVNFKLLKRTKLRFTLQGIFNIIKLIIGVCAFIIEKIIFVFRWTVFAIQFIFLFIFFLYWRSHQLYPFE